MSESSEERQSRKGFLPVAKPNSGFTKHEARNPYPAVIPTMSRKPGLPTYLPGNPIRGAKDTRALRNRKNKRTEPSGESDSMFAPFDAEFNSEGSDTVSVDSTTLDALLSRIEKTKSELEGTSVAEESGVQTQSHLRGLIDNLTKAAEEMEQIDRSTK
jgi:hypothetical protein